MHSYIIFLFYHSSISHILSLQKHSLHKYIQKENLEKACKLKAVEKIIIGSILLIHYMVFREVLFTLHAHLNNNREKQFI